MKHVQEEDADADPESLRGLGFGSLGSLGSLGGLGGLGASGKANEKAKAHAAHLGSMGSRVYGTLWLSLALSLRGEASELGSEQGRCPAAAGAPERRSNVLSARLFVQGFSVKRETRTSMETERERERDKKKPKKKNESVERRESRASTAALTQA